MAEQAPQTNTPPQPDDGKVSETDAQKEKWTVEKALREIPLTPVTHSTSPIPFFHLLERLKTTKREGWRRFDIDHGESISDHMYRMSIMTMLAPSSLSSQLDVSRCISMALVHDMAESLVGDITPMDNMAKTEKVRREADTMDFLCKSLLGRVDQGIAGDRIRQLWQEYEDGETLEAKFVHDVDKMELILQMIEYERTFEGRLDLGEFSGVAERIELEELKVWAEEVLRERGDYWKGIGKESSGSVPIERERHESQLNEYYGKGARNANGSAE
ncbi:hypothetical protein EV356DRAFT_500071 [Viridothelium virens]|uniref:5'-deoxynucleotidase n=1 Tax=Viridothelium virens TaxID=1048519 RepID=A0A6A6HBS4_VIRVR|nr:hypothetical protein EV356DRAFT_500071 [Viridothelium virens]